MRSPVLYIIFAILIIISSLSCKKKSNTATLIYVAKMPGTRVYHGTSYGTIYNKNDSGFFTTTDYSCQVSESATIKQINDTAYQIFADSVYLQLVFANPTIDTINKKVVFRYGPHSLTYYYSIDSVHFEFHDVGIHMDNNRVLSSP